MSVPFRSRSVIRPDDEPRVTIEMGGPNVLIRSSDSIDRTYTESLTGVLNAAAVTGTTVVLDPVPIRCDDSFAGAPLPSWETICSEHAECHPSDVEVAARGTVRIEAATTWWLVDIANGRFCRTDTRVDPRFIPSADWTPVVAVCITPTRLRALTADGVVVSGGRAHGRRAPVPLAG